MLNAIGTKQDEDFWPFQCYSYIRDEGKRVTLEMMPARSMGSGPAW
jgi:hypothetical protein